MSKFDDPFSRHAKSLFRGLFKFNLFFAFIGLICLAGAVGFATDFSNCFGETACANGAGGNFFLYPLGVIVLGTYGLYKWSKHQKDRYKNEVRDEVMTDMNQPPSKNQSNPLNLRILEAFDGDETLTTEDLMARTGASKDEVFSAIRQLLPSRAIKQKSINNIAQFTRLR